MAFSINNTTSNITLNTTVPYLVVDDEGLKAFAVNVGPPGADGAPAALDSGYLATAGTSSAYTATLAGFSATDGATIRAVFHVANAYTPTLAINGGAAIQLRGITDALLPGLIYPGRPYTLTYYGGYWYCPDWEHAQVSRNIDRYLAHDMAPPSLASANATVYSGVFTPDSDPNTTGLKKYDQMAIRVLSDVASEVNGVWLEAQHPTLGWIQLNAAISAPANTLMVLATMNGKIPYPLRVRFGNGAAAQGSFEAYAAGTASRWVPESVDFGWSTIAAGATVYSPTLEADRDGLLSAQSLYLRCDTTIQYWREVLVEGQWRRDSAFTLTTLVANRLTTMSTSTGVSDRFRYGAKNNSGSTANVSAAFVCGRGYIY